MYFEKILVVTQQANFQIYHIQSLYQEQINMEHNYNRHLKRPSISDKIIFKTEV